MENNKFKCCICGKEIHGYGNNPWPVMELLGQESDDLVCCDGCNDRFVIPLRAFYSAVEKTREGKR